MGHETNISLIVSKTIFVYHYTTPHKQNEKRSNVAQSVKLCVQLPVIRTFKSSKVARGIEIQLTGVRFLNALYSPRLNQSLGGISKDVKQNTKLSFIQLYIKLYLVDGSIRNLQWRQQCLRKMYHVLDVGPSKYNTVLLPTIPY